jgi:A/G-specific adenine glycosylase
MQKTAVPRSKILSFRKTVYAYFRRNGRTLPWRSDPTPYATFISEIMLQQTQVDRVVPLFSAFVKDLPDFPALANAPFRKVMTLWQGLGYNRRAVHLKNAAGIVMHEHHGVLPSAPELLETLPGIGKATAASIAAFGFNRPTVFLETNIRTALIHHFFSGKDNISDTDLLPIAEAVMDRKNPAKWYSAIMDYGTMLKKTRGNASRRSRHYIKQSKFEGSRRQIRGKILKLLLEKRCLSLPSIAKCLEAERNMVSEILDELTKEKLIVRRGNGFSI